MSEGLKGLKVIEIASVLAGPLAGRMLGDLGAEVIHIDRPGTIINTDNKHASVVQGGRVISSHINYVEENTNCNKKRITLDITSEAGLKILYRLLENADVFLTNFRPYELTKFHLEYDILRQFNPRLIQANLTAWGKNGPDKNMPGYDFNSFWTRSGIMHVLLEKDMPPFNTPMGMGDRIAGVTLAYGIMAALLVRERTGAGQEIDTSLLQAAVFANAYDVGGALVTGQDRQNVGREAISNPLVNSYRTSDDRWLRIAINKPERDWGKFCIAIGRPELEKNPDFATLEKRIENHRSLFYLLENIFAEKTISEWDAILSKTALPWGTIKTLPEVIADRQLIENGMFQPVAHPVYGEIKLVANPIGFSETPARIVKPAPKLSEHTEEILREYGYTKVEISSFIERKVIGIPEE